MADGCVRFDVRGAGCGVRGARCGVRSAECGVRSARWETSGSGIASQDMSGYRFVSTYPSQPPTVLLREIRPHEIMTTQMTWLKLPALLTILSLFASSANGQNNEAAVRAANAQFYTALNAIFVGDLEPMKDLWSHADDVTYMGPDGGFQIGWDQVLDDWQKQAAMKLGGKVEPGEVAINVGKDLAVCHNFEKGQNEDENGKTLTVSIRATNIFRKEGGVWMMIGHHTDLLPFLE